MQEIRDVMLGVLESLGIDEGLQHEQGQEVLEAFGLLYARQALGKDVLDELEPLVDEVRATLGGSAPVALRTALLRFLSATVDPVLDMLE